MGDEANKVRLRSSAAPTVRPRGVLALRPFGYLMIALVWTAISAVILALGPDR